MRTEIEAKFTLPDRTTLGRLRDLRALAGLRVGPWSVRRVIDTYYDTPHRVFMAAGYACRIREWEGRRLLTVKTVDSAQGVVHHRPEYEVELEDSFDPTLSDDWPAGPVRELIDTGATEVRLAPILTIKQTRRISCLFDGTRAVVELSLDKVRFGRDKPCHEVEVELLPGGGQSELDQVAHALQDEWGLVPVSTSKFARGLAKKQASLGPGRENQDDIGPADPMSEAGRKIFRFHFDQMRARELGTRVGQDIEELHDMRVATRRMRAALRIFKPYFHRKAIRGYNRGLSATGRALGRVRDLDVFELKARDYLATLPPDQQGVLDGLIEAWHKQRAAARRKMVAFLDSREYVRFLADFDRFLATPGAGSRPVPSGRLVPYQVRHVVPRYLFECYTAVRSYEPHLETASIDQLHALRIAFKRLRYALEFFTPVLGQEVNWVVQEVKLMQDHLGDLNDAAVAVGLLDEYIGPGSGDNSGLMAYRSFRENEQGQLVATFPTAWERFDRAEVRRNITLALARL